MNMMATTPAAAPSSPEPSSTDKVSSVKESAPVETGKSELNTTGTSTSSRSELAREVSSSQDTAPLSQSLNFDALPGATSEKANVGSIFQQLRAASSAQTDVTPTTTTPVKDEAIPTTSLMGDPKVEQVRKDFQELVGSLKANGYDTNSIGVTRGVISASPTGAGIDDIRKYEDENRPFTLYSASNPVQYLREIQGKNIFVDKGLNPDATKEDKLRLPPYFAVVNANTAGDRTVQVHDMLAPAGSRPIEANLKAGDTNSVAELTAQLTADFKEGARSGRFATAIQNIPEKRLYDPSFELVPTSDTKGQAALVDLIKKQESFQITSTPPHAETDRSYQPITLTPEQIGSKGIRINGELSSLEFGKDVPVETSTTGPDGKLTSINGKPLLESSVDKFGNHIDQAFLNSYPVDKGTLVPVTLEIRPPYPVSKNGEEFVKLDIDLTAHGYGVVSGIERKTLKKVDAADGLPVYTDFSTPERDATFKAGAAPMRNGIREAEAEFKVKPENSIDQLVVLNTESKNAFFSKVNPRTVSVHDEHIIGVSPAGLQNTGKHEAYHAIDGFYDYNLSAGKVQDFHKAQSGKDGKFFTTLNEGNFLVGSDPHSGHSQDNTRELFASLMNSTARPNWEQHVAQQSPEFRATYREALISARDQLQETKDFPQDAPILKTIAQRIEQLDPK